MNTIDKIDRYLNEAGNFEIGDYIKQVGSDFETYGVIIKKLKNGSYKAKVFVSYSGSVAGKAVQKSLSGWYPPPVKIDKSDIPLKILKKIG